MTALRLFGTQTYVLEKVSDIQKYLTPSFQRFLDADRVNEITEHLLQKLKRGETPWLPQCLCVAKCQKQAFLIDGQHRLAAYIKLLNMSKDYDLMVCVNYIEVANEKEMQDLFYTVNNTLPVTQLPEGVSYDVVNPAAKYFYEKHTGVWSTCATGQCRRPRVHKPTFETFLANLANTYELSTTEMIDKIQAFNELCRKRHWTEFRQNSNDSQDKVRNMLDLANGFFLGMFRKEEWAKRIMGHSQTKCHMTRVKKRIPTALRQKVWSQYMGKYTCGSCPFCAEDITVHNFHCAHDQADALGGEMGIDNLFPCCAACNLNSGIKSFEQFRKQFI